MPTLMVPDKMAPSTLPDSFAFTWPIGLSASTIPLKQFHVGIATITRPLPDVAALDLTQGDEWLIDVYLRGLRP